MKGKSVKQHLYKDTIRSHAAAVSLICILISEAERTFAALTLFSSGFYGDLGQLTA